MNAMMADLNKMMRDFEKAERRVEAQAAKDDPKANKLTQVTKAPTTYKAFEGGINRDGEHVFFCVADYVNAAGYVLSWRETRVMGKGVFDLPYEKVELRRRRQWAASKNHSTMIALAKRRAEKFAARMARVLAERDEKRAAKAVSRAATAKAASKAAKAEGGTK